MNPSFIATERVGEGIAFAYPKNTHFFCLSSTNRAVALLLRGEHSLLGVISRNRGYHPRWGRRALLGDACRTGVRRPHDGILLR